MEGSRSGGWSCWFSVFPVSVSILLCSLAHWRKGEAPSTRLMRALNLRDPVHDFASARSHEWLATCVSVQDVLSQGILSISTTCGISGCSEGSPVCYRQLVITFNPAYAR